METIRLSRPAIPNAKAPGNPRRITIADFLYTVDSAESNPDAKTHSSLSNEDEDFEFTTSLSSQNSSVQLPNKQRPEQKRVIGNQPNPCISFADELFYNGQLLPLPPRLKHVSDGTSGIISPGLSPPVSPRRVILEGLCFKNKEVFVDPFMAALERVRKEDIDKGLCNKTKILESKNFLFIESSQLPSNKSRDGVVGVSPSSGPGRECGQINAMRRRHAVQEIRKKLEIPHRPRLLSCLGFGPSSHGEGLDI